MQFTDLTGNRRTITLGQMPKHAATRFYLRLEAMVAAHLTNTPPDPQTAEWLRGVSSNLRRKLAAVGLTEAGVAHTVGTWADQYVASRKKSLARPRYAMIGLARDVAKRVLGEKTALHAVTKADAARVRETLLAEGLSEATVRKRCADIRMVFDRAVKARLIPSNPFEGLPTTVGRTESRSFVSESDVRKVMLELPDVSWRLLFALARWGGLRIPSEVQAMVWADVSWDSKRLTIRSSKTRTQRVIPLWPELESLMLEAFKQASDGQALVLPGFINARGATLFRTARAAMARAGVTWDRLWNQLRSTRETELLRSHPAHVVAYWMGHGTRVQAHHYTQVTDEDYDRALRAAPSAAHLSRSDAQGGALRNPSAQ